MEFKKNQTIYMQIADFICENILTEKWAASNKIPSVRELASQIEVNPNTVMRSYSFLQEQGVIYNKRGIGFFVSEDADKMIKAMQRQSFIDTEIPEFAKRMKLLDISLSYIEKAYNAIK